MRQSSGAFARAERAAKAAADCRTPRRSRVCEPRVGFLARAFASAVVGAFICCAASAQPSATNNSVLRFQAVDIYIDSKDKPLAAYQLEFSVTNAAAKIVGIEGGEHPAFSEPPFYDPKAMQHERVILAAFSTNAVDQLPAGKTRVATIHLQTNHSAEFKFDLRLQAAADSGGNTITVEASAQERRTK